MLDSNWVPVIENQDGDDSRTAKATLRMVFQNVLKIRECAEAIVPFKTNGTQRGHKVLDDSAAVDALIDSAPTVYADQIKNINLTQWERCQVLNQVLRRYFEIDKTGKLTGEPSKRLQIKYQAQEAA